MISWANGYQAFASTCQAYDGYVFMWSTNLWLCASKGDEKVASGEQSTVIDMVDEESPHRFQSVPLTSTPVKQLSCEPVSTDFVTSTTELRNLAWIYSTLIEGKSC